MLMRLSPSAAAPSAAATRTSTDAVVGVVQVGGNFDVNNVLLLLDDRIMAIDMSP